MSDAKPTAQGGERKPYRRKAAMPDLVADVQAMTGDKPPRASAGKVVSLHPGRRPASPGLTGQGAPAGNKPGGRADGRCVRSPRLANGLTQKQDDFARNVAEGLSLSEAYRRSFETENMKPATLWNRASELAERGEVRARVEAVRAERDRVALHDAGRARDWAIKRLQLEAETAPTDGARVRAVELVMRHHALLTDRVETAPPPGETAAELEAKLTERLTKLLGSSRVA